MQAIDYGVARLSLIPVRNEPSEKSEQVNQLLFGEHYEVLEMDGTGNWIRLRTSFDGYEGWISNKQHHSVSPEYFLYSNKAEFKITTELTTSILYNKRRQVILMGSIIPISSSELFKMEEQFAFNGEAKSLGQKRDYEFLKSIALRYLNAPYQWGGKGPFGIDCSGFVQMVFKISGYKLERDSIRQAGQGKLVARFEDVGPGDLAFLTSGSGAINHVGIVLESGKIIHASGQVRIDSLSADGIRNEDMRQRTHELVQVKRVMR
jgi:hypothetical protein